MQGKSTGTKNFEKDKIGGRTMQKGGVSKVAVVLLLLVLLSCSACQAQKNDVVLEASSLQEEPQDTLFEIEEFACTQPYPVALELEEETENTRLYSYGNPNGTQPAYYVIVLKMDEPVVNIPEEMADELFQRFGWNIGQGMVGHIDEKEPLLLGGVIEGYTAQARFSQMNSLGDIADAGVGQLTVFGVQGSCVLLVAITSQEDKLDQAKSGLEKMQNSLQFKESQLVTENFTLHQPAPIFMQLQANTKVPVYSFWDKDLGLFHTLEIEKEERGEEVISRQTAEQVLQNHLQPFRENGIVAEAGEAKEVTIAGRYPAFTMEYTTTLDDSPPTLRQMTVFIMEGECVCATMGCPDSEIFATAQRTHFTMLHSIETNGEGQTGEKRQQDSDVRTS